MDTNNKTLNFLYCFDYNYNSQAYSSMISLLDLVNEKIHIHILHNDLEKLKIYQKKLNLINTLIQLIHMNLKIMELIFQILMTLTFLKLHTTGYL